MSKVKYKLKYNIRATMFVQDKKVTLRVMKKQRAT